MNQGIDIRRFLLSLLVVFLILTRCFELESATDDVLVAELPIRPIGISFARLEEFAPWSHYLLVELRHFPVSKSHCH